MANTRFTQFMYTKHGKPVQLDVQVPIGASGAVGTLASGAGIKAVTKLATGIYQVQLSDNYNNFLGLDWSVQSPVTGSNVNDGSFSTGTVYQITAVGTTNWAGVGLPSGVTAAVGAVFKASGAGGAGSGTAKALGVSGVQNIEIIGATNTMLYPTGFGNQGGYITFQTLSATNSSTTTLIPASPANGCTLYLTFYMSDASNVLANNG